MFVNGLYGKHETDEYTLGWTCDVGFRASTQPTELILNL